MIHTINSKAFATFDHLVDLKELNRLKDTTCAAFARNYSKLFPAAVGDPLNWPDGSEPFIPKNPYTELNYALDKSARDPLDPLYKYANAIGKENYTLGYEYMKLMSNSQSIGSCMMLRYIKGTLYKDKAKQDATEYTPWSNDFLPILSWVQDQNIFKDWGRVIIFYNDEHQGCGIHRDYSPHKRPEKPDQFIWINLFPDRKQFFVLDGATGDKHYINSQTGMFDTSNWHGSDSHPLAAFSLRVDGIFSDEWLAKTNLLEFYSS